MKKAVKRKSEDNKKYLSLSKRPSNFNENSCNSVGSSNSVISSCLTNKLKVNCSLGLRKMPSCSVFDDRSNHSLELETGEKLKEIDENDPKTPFFNLITDYTEKENNPSTVPLKEIPKLKGINSNIDEVLLNVNNCKITPKKQILSLEEFGKLRQKVDASSKKINTDQSNETPIQDQITKDKNKSISFVHSMENLNEKIPKDENVNKCFNSTFMTPETPCDINDIFLDDDCVNQLQPNTNPSSKFQGRKCYDEIIIDSPLFYEQSQNNRKSTGRVQMTSKKQNPYKKVKTCEKIEEIPVEDVAKIIENDFSDGNYIYHIIDCRFPYEYEGGKIETAVNLFTPWKLLNYIFLGKDDRKMSFKPLENPEESLENLLKTIKQIKKPNSDWKDKAFIFHCEFSSVRGPDMARLLRDVDILANLSCYPKIFFPKLLIMKKGYSEFYKKFQKFCNPQNYVRMDVGDSENSCFDNSVDHDNSVTDFVNDSTKQIRSQFNVCKKELHEQTLIVAHFIKKLNHLGLEEFDDC